ncbi:unnamed protein product [Lepidochelys kempii]
MGSSSRASPRDSVTPPQPGRLLRLPGGALGAARALHEALGKVQVPTPVPETTETLMCALGLAVGIIGIIMGTILIIKGMKMNAARNPRGPFDKRGEEPGP